MVSQCANPECRAQFLYLREGKLFALRRGCAQSSRVEFFWLCGNCAGSLRLESAVDGGVRLVPTPEPPSQETGSDDRLKPDSFSATLRKAPHAA